MRKVYLECECTEHFIKDEKVLVEKGCRVKLVYSIETLDKVQEDILSKITNFSPRIAAEVDLESVKSVKTSEGFKYSSYTTSNIRCQE